MTNPLRSPARFARRPARRRKGAIMILFVLFLIPVLALAALCVDIGWITKARSELQNTADASASAGAAQFWQGYSSYAVTTGSVRTAQLNAAKAEAKTFATQYGSYNRAGDVSSIQIRNADILVGYTDASGNFDSNSSNYPNTVQVVARLDTNANGPLGLFLGPILGVNNQPLSLVANATAYSGLITTFDPGVLGGGGSSGGGGGGCGGGGSSGSTGVGCTLLPVAMDVNHWKTFVASGASPDGTTNTDSSGIPRIKVYPSPQNAPGNFGMLCIGPWTNANPDYSDWILHGPTASDLQYLLDNGKLPVSETASKSWKGSPGLRNSLSADFAAIIGQPRLLPLFIPASTNPYQAASGVGSNATYKICGFAGITIAAVSGNGNNLQILAKPCDIIDPAAVLDPATLCPIGAEPNGRLKCFTHPPCKFTR